QRGCAARAAATARSTSSALASGTSAIVSPVTGETIGRTFSPLDSTQSPPTKFSRTRTVVAMRAPFGAGSPFCRAAPRLCEPDSRVDPGVQEIDDEVEDDDGQRGEDDHALDGRRVVVEERPDRRVAEARKAVDGL